MKRKQKRKHLESTSSPQTVKKSRANLNFQVLQHGCKGMPPTQDQTARGDSSSSSDCIPCISSENKIAAAEFLKSHEGSSRPGPSRMVQVHEQMAKNSHSENIFCVSSPDKLIQSGIHQLHQDVSCFGYPKKLESSSPIPHASFPLHLVGTTKPSLCSEHPKEERLRLMRIYYMHVQMKRGVAVLCDGENGMEPPSKKTKIQEMTFLEKSPAKATLSYVSTKELLTDESSRNNEAQEERKEVESPAEPPALQNCSRPKTPEWLVALDSGYRCMGCCRVFPTLEVLKQHVQNGVSEGFSCRAFHLAFTCFKWKKNMEKKMRRKKKEGMQITYRCQKEKHFGIKVSMQTKR